MLLKVSKVRGEADAPARRDEVPNDAIGGVGAEKKLTTQRSGGARTGELLIGVQAIGCHRAPRGDWMRSRIH